MSKGLEALENICNQCEHYQFEKGLRPKKCPFNKSCVFKQRIEKELKALELMKKYNVRPSDFHYHTTYKVYLCNMSFADDDEIMNEEEYDLLKEVLL